MQRLEREGDLFGGRFEATASLASDRCICGLPSFVDESFGGPADRVFRYSRYSRDGTNGSSVPYDTSYIPSLPSRSSCRLFVSIGRSVGAAALIAKHTANIITNFILRVTLALEIG